YLGFINNQWLSIYSQHCANALLSLFTIVVFLADEQPRLGHKFLCYKKIDNSLSCYTNDGAVVVDRCC
ncbi:hypothetical protein, partial [Proteus mirabilis]|uniref:hypothetical protein n=1 Tax=Proteus mirabilis TaxID=584 RepID=UPI00391D4908